MARVPSDENPPELCYARQAVRDNGVSRRVSGALIRGRPAGPGMHGSWPTVDGRNSG